MERYNYSKDEATKIYYDLPTIISPSDANTWVSSWPSILGSGGCDSSKNGTMTCKIIFRDNQGLIIDIDDKTHKTSIKTQTGTSHLNSLSYIDENGNFSVTTEDKNTIGYSATIIENNGAKSIILMDPTFASSVFVKMFYHKGKGLKYYELFRTDEGSGFDVYTYKAKWTALP